MSRQKKIFTGLIITAVLLAIIVIINVVLRQQDMQFKPSKHRILYYSIYCPHCARVEKYIKIHKIRRKMALEYKEITKHRKNLNELMLTAKYCQQNTSRIGVPFLWTGKNCIVGDKPIINYFQRKIAKRRHAKKIR